MSSLDLDHMYASTSMENIPFSQNCSITQQPANSVYDALISAKFTSKIDDMFKMFASPVSDFNVVDLVVKGFLPIHDQFMDVYRTVS